MTSPPALQSWHELVAARDPSRLPEILAPDAIFHSPVVHRPQVGRDLVVMYLTGAMQVLANESFRYVREVIGPRDAVLEFVADVDGTMVNGVDMITWNDAGQITDFKVMLRPMRAIELVRQRMADLLAAM